ncbi:type II toxin-antitoxin system RelE/ParE family toxin [Xanthomonas fragariae]|uniref:type II toxin-antitoxin system RelE/ParE family toxin n=2 Tax=Xanthomonas fragariae TaxID=48664 RepID=UPI002F914A7E
MPQSLVGWPMSRLGGQSLPKKCLTALKRSTARKPANARMIVQLSADAEDDLERIGDYIAQDNPHRALSFVREPREKCMELASTPQAFPLVPR